MCSAPGDHSGDSPWQWAGTGALAVLGVFQLGFDAANAGLAALISEWGLAAEAAAGIGAAVENALCGQSFTAGTKVLLASGKAIPITKLKPGDKVLATNVKTGKTQAETVAAVMVHHDTDLYNLKIKKGTRTAVIHTTANHLFWDTTTRRWVQTAALHPGDHLRTPTGGIATVIDGYTPTQIAGWMWDLTITGDHDFYIDTTVAPVLVHNCPSPLGRGSTGRAEPESLKEQLAMEEVMSNPQAGKILSNITMTDSRWPASQGWVKMQQKVNGIVVHYVYNITTGAVDDFKFK